MKKYLFGLFAAILALSTVAFTSITTTDLDFEFQGLTSDPAQVSNPALWEESTISCNNNNVQACGIQAVSEQFYHDEGGVNILNTSAYASANPPEQAFTLTPVKVSGGSTYYVTNPIDGTARNKN